jgi:hypothetical protein
LLILKRWYASCLIANEVPLKPKTYSQEHFMRKLAILSTIACLITILGSGLAMATPFGTNITISDENFYANTIGWYSDREDQEVEPGMVRDQVWDLEGFFLNGSTLTMVGGYNFAEGEGQFKSGDIFISTTGKPVFGGSYYKNDNTPPTINDNLEIKNQFGYNYVIDLDFPNESFHLYRIDSAATLLASHYYGYGIDGVSNQASDPVSYISGGTYLNTGDLIYQTGLDDV